MTLDLELRQNLAEELRAECERIRTENAVFEARRLQAPFLLHSCGVLVTAGPHPRDAVVRVPFAVHAHRAPWLSAGAAPYPLEQCSS
jgi:hypothetical protein